MSRVVQIWSTALILAVAVAAHVGAAPAAPRLVLSGYSAQPAERRSARAIAAAPTTFAPVADARIEEARPTTNFGGSKTLRVDGGSDSEIRSYLRFDVRGVTGAVQSATLRLYVRDGGKTADGPALFAAGNDWDENTITWNQRPGRTGGPYDDAGPLANKEWVEFDATGAVAGDGVYTFALVAQSGDGAAFSSREGGKSPALVVASDGGEPTPPPTPGDGRVTASIETDPVPHGGDAADDPAIWIHPTDPAKSRIIGTDKKGGLAVYDLSGAQLAYYADSEPNNVDLRYNFPLGGSRTALVVASDADADTLRPYAVDPNTGALTYVAASPIEIGISAAGLCMYVSPDTAKFYAFVGDNSGTVQQWELFDDGGKVGAARVRTVAVGSVTEGCVADDETGDLYLSEENVGIWKYGAEPDAGDSRTKVDGVGDEGHLTADVEGLAVYYGGDGGGYLIASSQGSDTFVVYERKGGNDYVATFAVADGPIDGVSHTDGIDVTNVALGSAFPEGVFIAQDDKNDDGNQNFKLVPWGEIAAEAGPRLTVDTSWDPRCVGG